MRFLLVFGRLSSGHDVQALDAFDCEGLQVWDAFRASGFNGDFAVSIGEAFFAREDIPEIFEYQRGIIIRVLNAAEDFRLDDDFACPFGLMKVLATLLTRSPGEELVALARTFMEVVLDFPRLSFDFSESTSWEVSTLSLRRLMEPGYELMPWVASPVVQPALTHPNSATVPGRRLRVAVCNMHDGSAQESYTAALHALRDLGVEEEPEVKLYWTRIANHEGGNFISTVKIDEKINLNEYLSIAKTGSLSLRDFQVRMTDEFMNDDFFRSSDLWLCGEIVFPCILLFDELHRRNQTKSMATLMNMSLLTLFPWSDESSLSEFFGIFRRVAADARAHIAVACRVVLEQIRWQTGVALQYVRFQSRFVDLERALSAEASTRVPPSVEVGVGCVVKTKRVLFYRNNLFHLHNFHVFIKRMYLKNLCSLNFELVDMNDINEKLSFSDMSEFDAIILLSYIPNALRLTDAMALGRPVLTPGRDLASKYIWVNQPFGGFLAPENSRAFDYGQGNSSEPDPFPMRDAWSSVKVVDRMWSLTEWATTDGLTYFDSVADLLKKLNESDRLPVPDLSAIRNASGTWWRHVVSSCLDLFNKLYSS